MLHWRSPTFALHALSAAASVALHSTGRADALHLRAVAHLAAFPADEQPAAPQDCDSGARLREASGCQQPDALPEARAARLRQQGLDSD